MCGRFTMVTNPEALEERFHAHLSTELAAPTYNAAPSQAQLTILNDHTDAIVRAPWGFVPEWADGRPDVKPIINARSETVATKPFFRDTSLNSESQSLNAPASWSQPARASSRSRCGPYEQIRSCASIAIEASRRTEGGNAVGRCLSLCTISDQIASS